MEYSLSCGSSNINKQKGHFMCACPVPTLCLCTVEIVMTLHLYQRKLRCTAGVIFLSDILFPLYLGIYYYLNLYLIWRLIFYGYCNLLNNLLIWSIVLSDLGSTFHHLAQKSTHSKWTSGGLVLLWLFLANLEFC